MSQLVLFEMRLVEITFVAKIALEVADVFVNFDVRFELCGGVKGVRAILELTDELRGCVVFQVTCKNLQKKYCFFRFEETFDLL